MLLLEFMLQPGQQCRVCVCCVFNGKSQMCVCIFEFLSMSDSRPHRYSCEAVINECLHIKQLSGIEKQLLTVSQCCSCPQANPSYPQTTGGWGGWVSWRKKSEEKRRPLTLIRSCHQFPTGNTNAAILPCFQPIRNRFNVAQMPQQGYQDRRACGRLFLRVAHVAHVDHITLPEVNLMLLITRLKTQGAKCLKV